MFGPSRCLPLLLLGALLVGCSSAPPEAKKEASAIASDRLVRLHVPGMV